MKLHETELSLNRLDQYNQINNIEIQGIPSNVTDEAIENKVVNVFMLLNIDMKKVTLKVVTDLAKLTQKTQLFVL